MKKRAALFLAAVLAVSCLGGCGSSTQTTADASSEAVQEETQVSTQAEEETASVEANDKAILVVSFGTSYNDSRDVTIGAIETAIADAFSEYEIRRAFTSQIIIDVLKERESLEIDNVTEALDRAVADGVKELVVQPTHLMDGYEYTDLVEELSAYVDAFDSIMLSTPLLTEDADFESVMKAITEKTAAEDDGTTAICFMGHGTEAASNSVYAKLQEMLTANGYENYYIGTVEAEPSIDDVIAALNENGSYERVILEPLMVVAGDHANNDMAGDEEDSWKTLLEQEGYEVTCILEGLGQIPAIQQIYVEHLQETLEAGIAFTGVEKAQEEAVVGELTDGVYSVEVESDSSMFNIVKAELTVENGEMNAVITLSGTGYGKLYMGTAEEAATAEESDFIPFVEDEEGAYTYAIPVAALDEPFACAAFSIKKEEWYDRNLTFLSGSIGVGADTAVASEESATEGSYTVEITFAGGSGKAEILSPVTITETEAGVMATVEWNSENYDYMLVDGEKYLPINTEGNSVFEIPVAAFDEEITVIGDTVAMSTPHEIEYTIIFHKDTEKNAQ